LVIISDLQHFYSISTVFLQHFYSISTAFLQHFYTLLSLGYTNIVQMSAV